MAYGLEEGNMVHVPQTYKYTELPKDIQEKVLKAHEAKACEYDDWWCEIYDDTMHDMRSKGIDIDDVPRSASSGIRFTGFGSQGDGASFTGWVNLKEFLEVHKDILMQVPELYHMLGTAGQEPLVDIECSLTRVDNRYFHEKTVEFRWDIQWVDDSLDWVVGEVNTVGDLMNFVEVDIEDICRGYMKDLYVKLCQEYDYLQSEQCLINHDLRYTADGEEVW